MECSDEEYGSDSGEVGDDLLGPEDMFNDEADEGNDDAQSDKDQDEAVEDKTGKEDKVKKTEKQVKPKRVVRNPRVTLNFDLLKGPNGLSALKKLFQDFKFRGSGHEKEDLTKIMDILQQWMCYKLCPSYSFESSMMQLEALGKKKVVQTQMKKFRMGIDDWGDAKPNYDDEDDNLVGNVEMSEQNVVKDTFDMLLDEDLPNINSDGEVEENENNQTEVTQSQTPQAEITLTAEQLEKIARNRKLAEERRLKRVSSQKERMEVNEEPSVANESEIPIERMILEEPS